MTRTPRLLMISTVPDALRAFLLPHVRHFTARGWEIDGAASDISKDEACVRTFRRVWDVRWSRRPNWRAMRSAVARIREIASHGNYDLVHVHTPIAAFVTRLALRNRPSGRPIVIYTAHGFHFHPAGSWLTNRIFRELERLAGRWTDYLVVINRTDQSAAHAYGIVPKERIRYMPGIGVDTTLYAAHRIPGEAVDSVREELGLRRCDALLLMIAEFNAGKRHADMLRAFAKIPGDRAHLALAGEGPLRTAMERLADELGIRSRTHFLGFRRDICTIIRASRATILPSEREGLPRSILESLSLEVPVIGTRIRGIEELLSGGAGVLVDLGDIDGLARAMMRVLDDPAAAGEMGRVGRILMEQYDIRHVLELHESLYAEAVPELSHAVYA